MTAQWKLRRLASRALKVLSRHQESNAAIGAFVAPIRTASEAFIKAHSQVGGYVVKWRTEMSEGRGAMMELRREINAWKPHLARERPGFDLTTIADRPSVPEDLIEDGFMLAEQLDLVQGPGGTTPDWASSAAATLRTKCEMAEKETDEAATADSMYNGFLREARDTAAAFEAELGRFRATLRSVLGSAHPDVQKLRTNRATTSDVDDDPNAPAPSDPVTPAPEPPVL